MLTQQRLKEVIQYDKDTGEFTRKSCRVKSLIGKPAGTVKKEGRQRYLRIRIDGKDYYAHRLAWLYAHGHFPDLIDHRDRDGLNNKISNLRISTKSKNGKNADLRKNNSSGMTGVGRIGEGRWAAYVDDNYQRLYIGYFDSVDTAKAAREKYQRDYGH